MQNDVMLVYMNKKIINVFECLIDNVTMSDPDIYIYVFIDKFLLLGVGWSD